jgi:hypothetical protein
MMIIYCFSKDHIKQHRHLIQSILSNLLVEPVMQQQADHILVNHHYTNKRALLLYQYNDDNG